MGKKRQTKKQPDEQQNDNNKQTNIKEYQTKKKDIRKQKFSYQKNVKRLKDQEDESYDPCEEEIYQINESEMEDQFINNQSIKNESQNSGGSELQDILTLIGRNPMHLIMQKKQTKLSTVVITRSNYTEEQKWIESGQNQRRLPEKSQQKENDYQNCCCPNKMRIRIFEERLTRLQREIQKIQQAASDVKDKNISRMKIRRKALQISRKYKCPIVGCQKGYGSRSAAKQHLRTIHQITKGKVTFQKDQIQIRFDNNPPNSNNH